MIFDLCMTSVSDDLNLIDQAWIKWTAQRFLMESSHKKSGAFLEQRQRLP